MLWETWWPRFRDVILTLGGMGTILSQVFSPHPKDIVLVTGLALTVPSVAGHAGALLAGRPEPSHGPSSSRSPSSQPPSPPSSPPGATGE